MEFVIWVETRIADRTADRQKVAKIGFYRVDAPYLIEDSRLYFASNTPCSGERCRHHPCGFRDN